MDHETAVDTAAGISAIVEKLRPHGEVIVVGILPYSTPADPFRVVVNDTNALIKQIPGVTYHDASAVFLRADGTVDETLMPDLLHPNDLGYVMWSMQLLPLLWK